MVYRKFPYSTDWLINDSIFNDSINKIESRFRIDRSYSIPYLAGYSENGKILYIDKDLPKSFKTSKGKTVDTDRFILLHEAIEKCLIDTYHEVYQLAHQIALRVERDAVEANDITWKEYNAFMMKYVKQVGDMPDYTKIPSDLDLTPYKDEDKKIFKRMQESKKRSFKKFMNVKNDVKKS